MWTFIHRLQNKSLRERKVATYIITIVFFVIIVFLWLMYLNVDEAKKTNVDGKSNILSPFQSIKDIFTDFFEQTQTVEFPDLKNAVPQELIDELNNGGAVNDLFFEEATTTQDGVATSTLQQDSQNASKSAI